MKKQIFISAAVLLLSAALSAQTTQQSRPQGQGKTQAHYRTREQSGTMTQTYEKKGTPTRTQTGRQEAMQAGYKNNGQMTSAQKHARNEERKALKKQQKELKKQQKEMKKQQKELKKHQREMNNHQKEIKNQDAIQNREKNMEREKTATMNKSAHKAIPPRTGAKMSKSAGPGVKK